MRHNNVNASSKMIAPYCGAAGCSNTVNLAFATVGLRSSSRPLDINPKKTTLFIKVKILKT